MGDWIIIILALVFTVISGVSKNAKKKARERQRPESVPVPDDDPWSTIRKYLEDPDSAEEDQFQRVEKENHNTSVTPATEHAGAKQTEVSRNQYFTYEDPAVSTKLRNKAQEKHIPVDKPIAVSDLDEGYEDLMGDFDIRKAVLYSEILTPKFNE